MSTNQGLGHAGLRGFAWSYGALALATAAQMAYTIVTAKMVVPSGFAAYALSLSVLQLAGIFASSALGSSVARASALSDRVIRTAATLAILSGFATFLVLESLVPLVKAFWDVPLLSITLRLLALQVLILPLSSVLLAALRRMLRFKAAAGIELIAQLTGFAASVGLLVSDHGPVSLVASPIVASVVQLLLAWPTLRARLTPLIDRTFAREALSFAAHIAGQNVARSGIANTTLWIAGVVSSAGTTGQLSRALLLALLPLDQAFAAFSRVAYPLVSSIGSDLPRLRGVVTDLLRGIAYPAAQIFAIAAATSPLVVPLILGPQWKEAGSLAALFLCTSLPRLVYACTSVVAEARRSLRGVWAAILVQYLVLAVGIVFVLLLGGGTRSLILLSGAGFVAGAIVQLRFAAQEGWIDGRSLANPFAWSVVAASVTYLLVVLVQDAVRSDVFAPFAGTIVGLVSAVLLGCVPWMAATRTGVRRRLMTRTLAVESGMTR